MVKATILGAFNIGDERTCPHCGGVKDADDDICDDCDAEFKDCDDGYADELDEESGEVCSECGATEDVGRAGGRWLCDDCDDET